MVGRLGLGSWSESGRSGYYPGGIAIKKVTGRKKSSSSQPSLTKASTGIEGFDTLSNGGLPLNRTSLLIGGPGAGKTVFSLQCLVNAVRRESASGIFVTFEERPAEFIANAAGFDWGLHEAVHYGFMQFMADCVVRFGRRQEDRVASKWIQITKYRGSGFADAEFPLTFGPAGIDVATVESAQFGRPASRQRVSIGFGDLDALLDGGVFRGSSTMISGLPDTAKTTLAGKFAEAACARGERTLFVSYDESAEQIERNLVSVGIQLATHRESGLLRMSPARTEATSAEALLTKLKSEIREFRPRCIVIDPLTALSEADDPMTESTNLQISTIADTWVHLSYTVAGGERNRALTIVKSRGTSHSNQVRELLLSKSGPALASVYTAGGQVLMGTLRWEKEADEASRKSRQPVEYERKREELQYSETKTRAQITALETELERQRAEFRAFASDDDVRRASAIEREDDLRLKRGNSAGRPSGTTGKRKSK